MAGDLVRNLREEAERLSGLSLDRGIQEAGISANLADRAADVIEELEHALACAGGLDRTRVILIEDLKRQLREAQHSPLFRKALYDIIELDHHNMGPESAATTIARKALNEERDS